MTFYSEPLFLELKINEANHSCYPQDVKLLYTYRLRWYMVFEDARKFVAESMVFDNCLGWRLPVVGKGYCYINMAARRSSNVVGFEAILISNHIDLDLVDGQYR